MKTLSPLDFLAFAERFDLRRDAEGGSLQANAGETTGKNLPFDGGDDPRAALTRV